jgi:hypothetical protein
MRVQLVKRLTDKQQAKRIAPIMERWLRRLDLYNTWAVSVEIVCPSDLPKDALAAVDLNLPYQRATIRISRGYLARAPDGDLEHNLLHELVHLVLQPLTIVAEKHIPKGAKVHFQYAHESVTDAITHLLLWDSKGERNR